jgi:hypothetical protein
MSNIWQELILSIQQAVEEVFTEQEIQPPNCLEDDLAELEPSNPIDNENEEY